MVMWVGPGWVMKITAISGRELKRNLSQRSKGDAVKLKRIALDTNAVNRIADVPGLIGKILDAATRTPFIIIVNPMVKYEIDQTGDAVRREQLLAVWNGLPKKEVLTRGGYYGVGLKWGESLYGDGSDTGLSLDQARTGGRGGARDAIIAVTAAGEADVLVTDDNQLALRVRSSSAPCEVWPFEQFVSFLQEPQASEGCTSI